MQLSFLRGVALGVVSAVLLGVSAATAGPIQVTALTSNDYFDWGQLPNQGSVVTSPQAITSGILGRTGSISDDAGFTGLTEGTNWFGDFTVGDNVLYDGDPNNPFAAGNTVTVDLNTAVAGLGLQITSNFFGGFTAQVEVFDGATSLGVFSVSGVMDGNENGSAPFLGVLSDSADITSAVFTLTGNTGAGFGMNRLLTTDTPSSAVPEPLTLSLFGAGLAGAVSLHRRKKKVA